LRALCNQCHRRLIFGVCAVVGRRRGNIKSRSGTS
jgi:hypothetical protein